MHAVDECIDVKICDVKISPLDVKLVGIICDEVRRDGGRCSANALKGYNPKIARLTKRVCVCVCV
jgi:hypothetical protein